MTGTSGKSKTGKHYYYCHNKHYGRINADSLESTIISTIDEYLQKDKIKPIGNTAQLPKKEKCDIIEIWKDK